MKGSMRLVINLLLSCPSLFFRGVNNGGCRENSNLLRCYLFPHLLDSRPERNVRSIQV